MVYLLKSYNAGQITLPIKWRSKYKTQNRIAEEDKKTGYLILKPMNEGDDSVYYEDEKGFGIYSSKGIDPKKIISEIKKLQDG